MHRQAFVAMTLACALVGFVATAQAWHGGGGGGGHGGGGGFGGGFGGGGHGGGFGGGFYGGGGGHYGGYSGGGFYGGSGHSFSSPMGHGSTSLGGRSLGGMSVGSGMHQGQSQAGGAHANFMGKHFAGAQANIQQTSSKSGHNTANQPFHQGLGGVANHVNHPPGYWNRQSYFFGLGSPFFGYFWYPWFGVGLGGGYGGYGYYPWGSYGGGYGYPYDYSYQCDLGYEDAVAQAGGAQQPGAPAVDQLANSVDFAAQGEIEFKAGRYSAAVQNWRHALVDDPRNGAIVLLLSQALLQVGQYDEAAGAAQQALRMLPQDKWSAVVANYRELYDSANVTDYTNGLKAVEKARDAKPDSPGLRFLLGYHFGFLGYPKQAIRELDKVLELAPKDEVAEKLRDQFKAKLEGANAAPAPPAPAEEKPAGEKSSI